MLKLGWFSTGRGEGSRNLLTTVDNAISRGQIEAEIQFVFSNREPGEAEGSDRYIQLVRDLGLDLICYSSREFRKGWEGDVGQRRIAYDREVMRRLAGFRPDLCVLAGYMLIAGGEMCNHYTMINLHPAAPDGPEGTWQEVIWKLIEEQATHSGVKVHLATEDLDQGPTITFCTYPITGQAVDPHWQAAKERGVQEIKVQEGEGSPLFKFIRRQGMQRELPLLVETLKALADGSITIDRTHPLQPWDLTDKIEEILSQAD
ncbi:MAG: phosphoribosylglycinamide formyltransferase [Dehalococcoidia bacterium]